MGNGAESETIDLPSMSAGTRRSIQVLRYGEPGARPKAYLQASMHADEIPAMLVLNHLCERLEQASRRDEVRGEVIAVPVANPIGLAQVVQGRSLGRFGLAGGGNFNRHYPDLRDAVADAVSNRLGDDQGANVALVRGCLHEALRAVEPVDDLDFLRHTLLGLALDADIALDLHCDSEALMHLYLGTPLWPEAADLSAQIGRRATLLATDSGGMPFDEAMGGPWWTVAERFPERVVPPASLSATVELRGRSDVDEALAGNDADNLYRFLQRRGVLDGDPGPLPPARCEAAPLDGVDMVRSPLAGIISYERQPGDEVSDGDVIAVVIDPLERNFTRARTQLTTATSGLVISRSANRLARPGMNVAKVAGRESLAHRQLGPLLTD
jgi:predicted deacylase